jgi:hypothetical protein
MTRETSSEESDRGATKTGNDLALHRLSNSEPHLLDIRAARDVVPGMHDRLILTSGAPMAWEEYHGGQRDAVLYGAVYEGLAVDVKAADAAIRRGEIEVSTTQEHSCIGSVAGIFTASMPVFVVEDRATGCRAYCNLYEGANRKRLNYGSYDDSVVSALRHLEHVIAPVMGEALRCHGPIPLRPLMARALRMGDELHSRNTAATILLSHELMPQWIDMAAKSFKGLSETIAFLRDNEYSFLRVGMAASKATADAAHGIEGSSLVTGLAVNCSAIAIRVSGLGDAWFTGPHPTLEGRFFDNFGPDDVEWIGGESCVNECVGLGGFAQACAPTLQAYQGGTVARMLELNIEMYSIARGEHPEFRIPAFDFRGTPVGIDVNLVVSTGITPVIDGGLAGKGGGQIGAGVLRVPLEPFRKAAHALQAQS